MKINNILRYLEKEKINFEFIGNERDSVSTYSTLFNYKEGTFTFLSTLNTFDSYVELFTEKKIKLIIMGPNEKNYSCFENVIKVEYPKKTFFGILDALFVSQMDLDETFIVEHEKNTISQVSKNTKIDDTVRIGANCVIECDVEIGENSIIHHNVVIRQGTKIGANCIIHSGVILGESGFNPLKDEDGSRSLVKHYGNVEIRDHVHIGSGTIISKGTLENTVIHEGVKLNKHVNIAHNVIIGKHTIVTAPTFICGSVKIGEYSHIGATVIKNQCKIGNRATLGLGSVVIKDVLDDQVVIGNPAKPLIKE